MMDKILGINWKTTLAGIAAIVAAIGRIGVAWRTRDFESILTDGQLVMETVIALILGLGLLKAKDQNVTGTGVAAKSLDSSTGDLTNREGEVVGHQPVKT